jgi:hypothetical protein
VRLRGRVVGVVEDRVEGGVEDEVDEFGGGVVAAGGFAVVAGRVLQCECLGQWIAAGHEFEQ